MNDFTYSAFMEDATTTRTLGNIRRTLMKSIDKIKNIKQEDKEEIVNKILSIHGLSKDRFDFVSKMEEIISGHLNDVSIDSNSNKNEKTLEGIHQEVVAPIKKAVGYDILYRMMVELYGKKEAKRLTGQLYNYSLAMHDSVSITRPYCWSFNASILVTQGRQFGQLYSKPVKRVNSYISCLCESIHQLSSHVAGAVAVGTLFYDIAHILFYKENRTLEEIKTNKELRKYIENELQQFVHSVNHLSRNGIESIFSNISIFDRPKLRTLIEELSWYFYDVDVEYFVDYVMELQKLFLKFFDKGDPSFNGIPYRFPVVTLNFSKINGEENEIIDKEFLEYCCNLDIYRYNIFASEGTKISSCCRLLSDKDMLEIAGQINSFGGTSISLGSHRVVTINFNRISLEAETEEEFFEILNNRVEDTAKILKAHKELINKFTEKGLQPFISNGWISMKRMFSTFGLLGIFESVNNLEKKFGKDLNRDLTKEILIFFNNKVKFYSGQYGLIGNVEQVPGETMASKLAKVDKLLYGDLVFEVLYANQFVPLWEEKSIWERLETDGKYNKLLTGGGIVHATIGEKVTAKQAEKLIRYAVKVGCEHFALNAVYCKCENNHVSLGRLEKCPICEKKIKEYYSRVVGFFTPVSSWEKTRRNWEFPNRYLEDINEEV